jgi:hypothetical protein
MVIRASQLFALRAVIVYPDEREAYCPVDQKLDHTQTKANDQTEAIQLAKEGLENGSLLSTDL